MTPSTPRSRLLYLCCFGPSPLGPLLALCELTELPQPLRVRLRLWSWCALGRQAHLCAGQRHRRLPLPPRNGKWSALGGLVASGASTSDSLEFRHLQSQLLPSSLGQLLQLLLLLPAQLLQLWQLLLLLLLRQLLGVHDGEVPVPTRRLLWPHLPGPKTCRYRHCWGQRWATNGVLPVFIAMHVAG